MERITFINLFGVSVIAFFVPFLLGFFPRLCIPAAVLELVAGILFGPAMLGWIQPGPVVTIISHLGVAFLLFLAGLDLDLVKLRGAPLKLGGASFLLSFAIALVLMLPLGASGLVLSPLLCSTALSATSVGIVIMVLRDAGRLDTAVGTFTVAGGAAAEFGTIGTLGVFFAGATSNAWVEAVFLAVVAVAAVLLLVLLSRAWKWEPGRQVARRLDDTTSQAHVRLAVMILLGAAVLASTFRFEAILGTFLAGAVLAVILRGDRFEQEFRRKIDAVGFGFFVPVFFVTSGLRLSLDVLTKVENLGRIALFFVALVVIRGVPALLFRKHLSGREMVASGLMMSTNLSFIVVAATVGIELNVMRQVTATALILAGLLSAALFPAIAQSLISRSGAPAAERSDAARDVAV